MERIKKNCPVAMREEGKMHYLKEEHETAVKYYTKAAELGDVEAHYNSAVMYHEGHGVEKDMKKYKYYMEEAAIGGQPDARHNLGREERHNGRFERARKHFIIAANLGYEKSLECLKDLYADGYASKEDYANALRGYQAALEAAKSPEREQAEVYYEAFKVQLDKGRWKI
jgi:TPR repeat protein